MTFQLCLNLAASGQDASIIKGPQTQVIEKGEDFTISCRTNIQVSTVKVI